MNRVPFVLAACFLTAGFASAQSLNIDVGANVAPFGVPAASYGAAAGQAGTWNAVTATSAMPQALVDLSGAAVGATITRSTGSALEFTYDNPFVAGDEQLLLEDAQDVGLQPSFCTWTLNGLVPGHYTTYTYAWAPDNITYVTTVNGSSVGGAWPGSFVAGVTHAVHTFSVAPGGSIVLTINSSAGYGTFNGLQIIKDETPTTSYCSGDGSGTACPCGNAGAAGNGCGSSVNTAGARIAGSGLASISIDTFTLTGTGMPNSSALYFQGTARVNGGNGSTFGDGLRCAGGTTVRLGTKANAGGTSSYPTGSDVPISIKGSNAAGNVRDYQCWYRNAAPFCMPETFNLTNAVEVTWIP